MLRCGAERHKTLKKYECRNVDRQHTKYCVGRSNHNTTENTDQRQVANLSGCIFTLVFVTACSQEHTNGNLLIR